MKWDDIQIHFSSTSGADSGAFWVEGNINGGKAEQKGVELNGQWYATRAAELRSGASSSRAPSSPRTRSSRTPILPRSTFAKDTTMPVSPKEKYWASVEYTFPDFLPLARRLLDAVLVHLAGQDLGQPDRDRRTTTANSCCPQWKSGTFQLGFTSDNELGGVAHRAQPLRRQKASPGRAAPIEASSSAIRAGATCAACSGPRSVLPLVHQEVVTATA